MTKRTSNLFPPEVRQRAGALTPTLDLSRESMTGHRAPCDASSREEARTDISGAIAIRRAMASLRDDLYRVSVTGTQHGRCRRGKCWKSLAASPAW